MSCLLLSLVATAVFLAPGTGLGQPQHSVAVGLDINPTSRSVCNSAGLITPTVLLQFRIAEAATAGSGGAVIIPDEWTLMAEIPVDKLRQRLNNLGAPSLSNSSNSSLGVQFRLLQLEHGGGICNCWNLAMFSVKLDGGASMTLGSNTVCFDSPTSGFTTEFCQGGVGTLEARGMITTVLYFSGNNGERCPGDSGLTLISRRGPAFPLNCAMITPRM